MSVNAKRVTLKDIDVREYVVVHMPASRSTVLLQLEVKPGELLAIVGPVGSGKSSLLAGVVGQLPLVNGALRVDGKIAYATQQAWMTNESLRNNVLFSSPLDEERYAAALSACQLLPDLEQLPAGDRTEIGERGINLSGGQKQRVSLARAVYSNRDVYLLDDVLSAVDQHVGKKLFTKCIKGALESKTRLFVTNQLQYLPACDRVAVLRKGEIVGALALLHGIFILLIVVAALGRYDELVAKNVDFGVPLESKQEKKDKKKLESTREDKMEEMQFASPPVALKATVYQRVYFAIVHFFSIFRDRKLARRSPIKSSRPSQASLICTSRRQRMASSWSPRIESTAGSRFIHFCQICFVLDARAHCVYCAYCAYCVYCAFFCVV